MNTFPPHHQTSRLHTGCARQGWVQFIITLSHKVGVLSQYTPCPYHLALTPPFACSPQGKSCPNYCWDRVVKRRVGENMALKTEVFQRYTPKRSVTRNHQQDGCPSNKRNPRMNFLHKQFKKEKMFLWLDPEITK